MTTTWNEIRLHKGGHGPEWRGEQCTLELANLLAAGEVVAPPELLRVDQPLEWVPFSDDHPSISRVIRSLVLGLNDAMDDEPRQRLKPYAARILGTATGPATEEARALLATDWLVRVYAPALLRLAGLEEHANTLAGMERIADAEAARSVLPVLDGVREAANAVKASAWDAGWEAVLGGWGAKVARWSLARDAALRAATEAIGAAVGEAVRIAVGEATDGVTWPIAWAATWVSAVRAEDAAGGNYRIAAGDVARIAAGNAAWGIAWNAALAAAGKAARDAAREVAEDDWEAAKKAARDAVWDMLRPTVGALQASALALLDAMLAV